MASVNTERGVKRVTENQSAHYQHLTTKKSQLYTFISVTMIQMNGNTRRLVPVVEEGLGLINTRMNYYV